MSSLQFGLDFYSSIMENMFRNAVTVQETFTLPWNQYTFSYEGQQYFSVYITSAVTHKTLAYFIKMYP